MTGSTHSSSQTSMAKYTKVLPVSIRKNSDTGIFHPNAENIPPNHNHNPGSMQCSGEQREFVRVTLAYPSPSYGTMNPHKEIVLRLTSDENPLFYYHLRVTETEFPNLRLQQGLLVDFYGFPGQLVSLLDRCDPNSSYTTEGDGGMHLKSVYEGNGPKFVLVMKMNGENTVLDIVESNPFKYLCHLSLQINPGTDGEVKKFLCDVTTSLKKDNQLLQDKYNHLSNTLESELARLKTLYEAKCTELNRLRDEVHNQTTSMTSKHFQELTEEKEKILRMQSELVAKFDQERSETDKQNKQAQKNLQNRISALEAENQSLTLVKANQESALQDASNRLRICGDELKKFQQELAGLRQQNTKLDYDYHQMRLSKMECQREVQSLDKIVKKHEEAIQKYQKDIIDLTCEKKKLEEQKQDLSREMEKLRNSSLVTASELVKANEIIKKLQDDIRSSHAKNKQQAVALAESERRNQEKDALVQNLKDELGESKKHLISAKDELSSATTEVSSLQEKVKEFEATVESNENMISWLNKQLNELQGLSDLNKFRINLAAESSGRNDTLPISSHSRNSANEKSGRKVTSKMLGEGQITHTQANGNNTVGGGSPSWLNIYQSTGNHGDRDLSSRLEHVSALGAILNSQSKHGGKDVSRTPPADETLPENAHDKFGKGTKNGSNKQPLWAKSKPKVTLDTMLNKPTFPIWKNK